MYVRQNVVKPLGKSPGAAAAKEPNVVVIATDDILTWPMRDSKGVKHVGNFVMKPNAKMIEVYMTPSKLKASYGSEGDEDAVSFAQKFEGEHPGNELEINEFVQNWTGVNCVVIYGSCSDAFRKVMGTKCAPMQLKPSLQDDNDGRKTMLVFEQAAKSGFVPGHYTGALSFAEPFAIADAGNILATAANGNMYKVPSLDVTVPIVFSEVSLAHGAIITLVGGGGSNPATLATGTADLSAILKDGTTWVALESSVINLQVFVAGDNTYLLELSRS